MRNTISLTSAILLIFVSIQSAFAQRPISLANNAALRYWSAFSQVDDTAIADQQAEELNSILDGTVPYDDSKYKDLLQKNTSAIEIMGRATSLPNCDWGLDYGLGEDVPVDYARKALVLGRLNVLYAFHLFVTGNKDGGVRALTSGLKFSRDVANGGSLFSTLVAKDLLVTHLRAVGNAIHLEQLTSAQRSRLQDAVVGLGKGLDWSMAAERDLEALRQHYAGGSQSSAAVTRIVSLYGAFLNNPSKLPQLTEAINSAPQQLRTLIPNAQRVLEQKQQLSDRLLQTRSLLQ